MCYNKTDRSVWFFCHEEKRDMARQQRGQESRERILEAAQLCFAQEGYDATGVAQICRRAGLSKGAFYHHFATKQALFLELLNRWLGTLDTQFAAIRAKAPSVAEGFARMTEVLQHVLNDAGGQLPLFLEFWNQARREPAVWEATIAPYRRYRAYFAEMIAEGIAQGSLREVDPDVAAGVWVSLAVGLLLQNLLDPDGADWEQVARAGVEMLLVNS
jgi:TetR/AcrR family transcriptional repressor of uid operon